MLPINDLPKFIHILLIAVLPAESINTRYWAELQTVFNQKIRNQEVIFSLNESNKDYKAFREMLSS